MLLAYSLLGGSALFMMYQDVREQTIPLSGLFVFMLAALLHQVLEPDPEGLWAAITIALIFMSCQGIFYLIKHEFVMGWGDLTLSPFCGLWLSFYELPSFFIATGVFALMIGILWRYQWGMRTFPMAPALLLGLGFVFLIRCFSTVHGI